MAESWPLGCRQMNCNARSAVEPAPRWNFRKPPHHSGHGSMEKFCTHAGFRGSGLDRMLKGHAAFLIHKTSTPARLSSRLPGFRYGSGAGAVEAVWLSSGLPLGCHQLSYCCCYKCSSTPDEPQCVRASSSSLLHPFPVPRPYCCTVTPLLLPELAGLDCLWRCGNGTNKPSSYIHVCYCRGQTLLS